MALIMLETCQIKRQWIEKCFLFQLIALVLKATHRWPWLLCKLYNVKKVSKIAYWILGIILLCPGKWSQGKSSIVRYHCECNSHSVQSKRLRDLWSQTTKLHLFLMCAAKFREEVRVIQTTKLRLFCMYVPKISIV